AQRIYRFAMAAVVIFKHKHRRTEKRLTILIEGQYVHDLAARYEICRLKPKQGVVGFFIHHLLYHLIVYLTVPIAIGEKLLGMEWQRITEIGERKYLHFRRAHLYHPIIAEAPHRIMHLPCQYPETAVWRID